MIRWKGDILRNKRMLLLLITVLIYAIAPYANQAVGKGGTTEDKGDWKYNPREIRELKKRYPLADAVIMRHAVKIEMDELGMQTRSVSLQVALFTDNAIRRYADPRILYNSESQELMVSVARVYMRDGTKVDSGNNAFNQTTPFALSQAPDYTNWQEMVVTHVGIEKDCVAELVYTIRDKKRIKSWLSGVEHLAFDDPCLSAQLTITIPSGGHLDYHCSNGVSEPTVSGESTYHWQVENIPCHPPVDAGVWRGDHMPTVVYSTAHNWEQVADYIRETFRANTASSTLHEKRDGNASCEDAILDLHKETKDCARAIHAPFGLLEAPARSSARIYSSAYAHELDRAVLLSGRLADSGVNATPVLVTAVMNCSREVPAPELFERILLEVIPEDSKKALLLDPIEAHPRDVKCTFAGRTMLRCGDEPEIFCIEEGKADDNISSIDITLTISEEGKLSGEASVVMQGVFSPYYSVRGVENETEDFMKSKVQGLFPGATLQSWNIRALQPESVEAGFRFEAEMPEATEQNRVYLHMPRPFLEDISLIGGVHIERTEYPVPIRVIPCRMKVSLTFDNLADYCLFEETIAAEEENSVGRLERAMHKSTQQDDASITVTKDLTISKSIVPREEYSLLRSLLLGYEERLIILEKTTGE